MLRKSVTVLVLFLAAGGSAAWGQKPNPPVRIALRPDKPTASVGEQVNVTLELRDAYNLAAFAPKDYLINLEMWSNDKVVGRQSVLIPRGRSSVRTPVLFRDPGIVLLKATNPELREDAAWVRVRSGGSRRAARLLLSPWFGHEGSGIVPALWQFPGLTQPDRRRGSPGVVPVQLSTPPGPSGLGLDLMYSDMGAKLTANGSDRAKISAFLTDVAPRPLSLLFFNDGGVLVPNPLVIPAGQDFGETYLTSEKVGTVRVGYVHCTPNNLVLLRSGGQKDIQFDLAIKEVSLKASPPWVPLGDTSEIQVELLDLRGDAIRLPAPRTVYLALDAGLGDFESNPVEIPADSIQGRSRFTARTTGAVRVSAMSYGAQTRQPLAMDVYFSLATPILVFLCAAVPSLLRVMVKPIGIKRTVSACLLSGFTALMVCGLAVFGLYHQIPPKVVLNPLGACTVAIAIGLGMTRLLRPEGSTGSPGAGPSQKPPQSITAG
jgi:hypothetical protein